MSEAPTSCSSLELPAAATGDEAHHILELPGDECGDWSPCSLATLRRENSVLLNERGDVDYDEYYQCSSDYTEEQRCHALLRFNPETGAAIVGLPGPDGDCYDSNGHSMFRRRRLQEQLEDGAFDHLRGYKFVACRDTVDCAWEVYVGWFDENLSIFQDYHADEPPDNYCFHSSMLGTDSQKVRAAGYIEFSGEGNVSRLIAHSGHYKPKPYTLMSLARSLIRQKVVTSDFRLDFPDVDGCGPLVWGLETLADPETEIDLILSLGWCESSAGLNEDCNCPYGDQEPNGSTTEEELCRGAQHGCL